MSYLQGPVRRIAGVLVIGGLVAMLTGCGAQPPAEAPHPIATAVDSTDLGAFCASASALAVSDPAAAIDLIDSVRAPAAAIADRQSRPLSEDEELLLVACADVRLAAARQVAVDKV